MAWLERLHADPLPWLLAEDTPAVRAAALQCLLDRRSTTATSGGQGGDHDAQPDQGDLGRPEPRRVVGEARAGVRDQVPRNRLAGHLPRPAGRRSGRRASPARVLLRLGPLDRIVRRIRIVGVEGRGRAAAVDGHPLPERQPAGRPHRFGYVDDPRVQGAVAWGARAITGEGMDRWHRSGTGGPGFACAANEQQPCAWGAVKELRALTRVPLERRTPLVSRALEQGSDFLLSRDPAAADYPMGFGNTTPSSSWYKLGFPSAYVADVLQNLEVLVDLGHGHDARLTRAVDWLLGQQDARGRWRNRYAYNGKTWCDIEPQGQPSKWVTLRACRVLRAVLG